MNYLKKILIASLACISLNTNTFSQNSVSELMGKQDQQDALKTEPVLSTFESTRLALGHSVETSKKKNLDFRISHRFSRIDEGFYDMFGMDAASIRLGFDYGITDRLMVGIGRSSFDKEYDISAKYRVLHQATGENQVPLSLSLLGEGTVKTLKNIDGEYPAFSDMLGSAFQVLVARKFSGRLSLQLTPTWIYTQKPVYAEDPQNIFTVGLGGSFKITKRMSINVEYYPLFGDNRMTNTTAPLTLGMDMQTGGHVFQLFVSNSFGSNERQFISQTYDRWDKGQLHIGFNILRVFSLTSKQSGKDAKKNLKE